MNTRFKRNEDALRERKWKIVDAAGVPVGRVASEVASLIRGKNKVDFTPHVDGGDFVVVINASKVVFTGNKASQKKYYWHTGYIGGIKEIVAQDLLDKNPGKVIKNAVKGMLPGGVLGHRLIEKLKVYADDKHPHAAQKPEKVSLQYIKQAVNN